MERSHGGSSPGAYKRHGRRSPKGAQGGQEARAPGEDPHAASAPCAPSPERKSGKTVRRLPAPKKPKP
jgi:hypothetical protein